MYHNTQVSGFRQAEAQHPADKNSEQNTENTRRETQRLEHLRGLDSVIWHEEHNETQGNIRTEGTLSQEQET